MKCSPPREMPVGIQDFEKLRTDKCVYVDKTKYVYDLTRTDRPYFLGRPRLRRGENRQYHLCV